MTSLPKCFDCGKFCHPAAWKMVYSGVLLMPDGEIFRCAKCVERHGPFEPQLGVKPEFSSGLILKETT